MISRFVNCPEGYKKVSPVAHRAPITLETVLTHALGPPDSIAVRVFAQLLLVSEEIQKQFWCYV